MFDPDQLDVVEEWFYEDQVVKVLVTELGKAGYKIGHVPSAELKEQGVDITAEKDGQTLLFEVKGYPSEVYRDENRRHEPKKTRPSGQAQHWYSHALLKVMRLQQKNPRARIAMGFPEFERNIQLYRETCDSLTRLDIAVFFVRKDGTVFKANPRELMREAPITDTPILPAKSTVIPPLLPKGKPSLPSPVPVQKAKSYRGKYNELAAVFATSREYELSFTFSEIDRIVDGLPRSARVYSAWWANDPAHSQAVWMEHGFKSGSVDILGERVKFHRR